jgi:penicillin-binding protein 1A
VRIGQEAGIQRVASLAHQLGISTDIPPYPSAFLGAADVIPAELVAAYAPFGNGGRTIEPHFITRIEDPEGRVVYRRQSERGHRSLDPRVAFQLLDVMRDVATRGTGWRVAASGLSFPSAGKTGTTNESRDVWYVGMTQGLLAGVWLGFDDPKTIVSGASGGDLAAPVWASFMQVANRERGAADSWEAPEGIIAVEVDARSGYRVSDDCPAAQVRTEYFLEGTEPSWECPYQYDWNGWGGAGSPTYPYMPDTAAERRYRERLRYLDSLGAVLRERARPQIDTVAPPVPPPSAPAVPPPTQPTMPTQPPPPTQPPLPTAPDTVWLPPLPTSSRPGPPGPRPNGPPLPP